MANRGVFLCTIVAALIAAALPSVARGQAPPAEMNSAVPIERWIADLDSREYKVREAATRQLAGAGETALDPLLMAANGDRLEPAERAIAILQERSRSGEDATAIAALQRLALLRNRPQIAKKAESEIARITILACKKYLEARGAECQMQLVPIPSLGGVSALVFHVRLGANWHGTVQDIRVLAELRYQPYVRLEGAPIDDTVLKLFETTPAITWLQLWQTKVSVAAVNSLKQKRPQIEIYMRNRALTGVACEDHESGALVSLVEPGSAAEAAGVLAGDIITKIDGNPIPDFDRLTANVAQHEPGDQITIDVLRGEETHTLTVTLGSWELRQAR